MAAESPAKNTKTPVKSSKIPSKSGKTPAKATKTPAKSSLTPKPSVSKGKFATPESSTDGSIAMKSAITEVQVHLNRLVPKLKEDPYIISSYLKSEPSSPEKINNVVKKILISKTPVKTSLKRKTEAQSGTPSKKAKIETPEPKSDKVASDRNPGFRKTPGRVTSLKPLLNEKKTPAYRKISARTVSTPVQINPANLLRKNLKTKVETAIVSKISEKPNSSPYLLSSEVS